MRHELWIAILHTLGRNQEPVTVRGAIMVVASYILLVAAISFTLAVLVLNN